VSRTPDEDGHPDGPQRMEAVDRIAAGLAHDFSNLLIVISGYCEIAEGELESDRAAVRDAIDHIKQATDRAAVLTRQLLGLRRDRFEVDDVNGIIRGIASLLRRALGGDVDLVLDLQAGTGHVPVDAQRFELALINLALNARDAMPEGGTVTIATGNLAVRRRGRTAGETLDPGDYLRVTVSDTGDGMDAETRSRAFEPFFTTKPAEKGSGLGLSSVSAFVRDSGGTVRVESRPGRGTTVEILL